MADERPNLVFIMADHQRADSLGMVQAGREVTPHLNRLAASGAVFTRAYSTCPLCVPARTALATGKYPTRNGVVFNDWRGLRAGDHQTIHECLAGAGYDVGHIGVHHIRVKPGLETRVGFAKWIESKDYQDYAAGCGIAIEKYVDKATYGEHQTMVRERRGAEFVPASYSNTRTSVWPYPEEDFRDAYFCRQAVDFIREKRERPFAVFLCLWSPHPPLQVPQPYDAFFPPAELELPSNVGLPARGEPANRRLGVAAQLAEGVSANEWPRVWAAHLGLVHLADAHIGRVLRALDETGQAGRTIVVFTSDHGDHLGQHRMYQKNELYEQAIRVPLVIHIPGVGPREFDSPVSHLDVMPSVLALTGAAAPADLDGVSLGECLVSGTAPPERPAFAQYSGNSTLGDIRRGVITRRYKYIYDPDDQPELYDLVDDPLEMNNLANEKRYADVIEWMRGEAGVWARAHGDWLGSA